MSQTPNTAMAVIGIDIGKNSFHVVGHDARGAIVLRQKWSRGQVEARLANIPPCLIGMEACVGAHHLSRKLASLGHDARLMPAKYVRPYSRGQKNDFNDAEAIAEAVQRPTMKFVATKTVEQLDLQALLVSLITLSTRQAFPSIKLSRSSWEPAQLSLLA
ncbi:transposase [Nitrobacteraceae bacterium AZCC 2146]